MIDTGRRRRILAGGPALCLVSCLAGLSAGIVILVPTPANAYVRYLAKNGSPYAWASSCVQITGYPQGLPSMTDDEMRNAITQAVGAWSRSDPTLGACSYLDLQLTLENPIDTLPDAKYDRYNNVVFRSDAWITLCSTGPDGVQVCHEPSALAITSVFAKTNGEILDADVEVNAVNFEWADVATIAPTRQRQDLQNALTHEMGHLIGLDHTCYIFGSGGADDPKHPRPVDENGQAIPDCSNSSPDVEATTMFASANPGDISKRTLEPDDQHAVCAVYPLASDPNSCAPAYDQQAACDAVPRSPTTKSCPPSNQDGRGGCAVAAANSPGGAGESRGAGWLIAAGLASILMARTRRGARPPRRR